MPGVDGFMYPNEVELQWSVLIVLYPFITGLVAGAFILASLGEGWCPGWGSNPQDFRGRWILSPLRLPIPPPGRLSCRAKRSATGM